MTTERDGIRVTISLDEKSVRCLVEHVASVFGTSAFERSLTVGVAPEPKSANRSLRKKKQPIRVSDK